MTKGGSQVFRIGSVLLLTLLVLRSRALIRALHSYVALQITHRSRKTTYSMRIFIVNTLSLTSLKLSGLPVIRKMLYILGFFKYMFCIVIICNSVVYRKLSHFFRFKTILQMTKISFRLALHSTACMLL